MKIVGIIPSRLESSRLPNKALIDIEGLPMIVHVFKRALLSSVLDEVYVATDNAKIFDVVQKYGGKAIMTSSEHNCGTNRVCEASKKIDADIIVNIQGDEPLLVPEHIDNAVKPLIEEENVKVAVLVTPYKEKNRASDIKAVLDLENNILYSSRTDIPSDARSSVEVMWKMCFIVPFRKEFLLKYASWDQTPLEKVEYNEYLRILENGYKIRAVPVENAHISVDTKEDLEKVIQIMKEDIIKKEYMGC